MRLYKRWTLAVISLAALFLGGALFAQRAEPIRGGYEGKPPEVKPIVPIKGDGIKPIPEGPKYSSAERVLAKARSVPGIENRTREIEKCVVFVTKEGDDLYLHSNFGASNPSSPTKIATKKNPDLKQLFVEHISSRDGEAHTKTVNYYLDQSLFDSQGTLNLELGGAENVYVHFEGTPLPKRLKKLNPIRGPPFFEAENEPFFVAEYESSLFVKVTPTAMPNRFFTKLKERPFNAHEVCFVSLMSDSEIDEEIKKLDLAKIRHPLASPSKEKLQDFFKGHTGKVVLLLGHCKGENFVNWGKDESGTPIEFTIPLSEIEDMAATARCDVFYLGCNSALSGHPIVGANKKFHYIDTVKRLAESLNAKTYFDFLKTLANDDMGLVLPERSLERTTKRSEAEVYTRKSGNLEDIFMQRNLSGRAILFIGGSDWVDPPPPPKHDNSSGLPCAFLVLGGFLVILVIFAVNDIKRTKA